MNIEAVGFDLVGTLIGYPGMGLDWSEHYPAALSQVAQQLNLAVTEAQTRSAATALLKYNTRVNTRIGEVDASVIFQEVFREWGEGFDKALAMEIFFDYYQRSVTVYEDTLSILRTLRRTGIKTGILSDAPYGMPHALAEKDISAFQDWVDVFLTSVDTGIRKPQPDGLIKLASSLEVKPDKMLYIGNEKKDITAAKAAGMVAVLIDRAGSREFFGQNFTINSLEELETWI